MTDSAQQQIQDVLNAYARACDARDFDKLAQLVTDDVEIEREDGVHRGKEAFLGVYRELLGDPEVWSKHLIVNVDVRVDGDTAEVASYFQAPMDKDGQGTIVFGEYADGFRRIDGRWWLSRKGIRIQRIFRTDVLR